MSGFTEYEVQQLSRTLKRQELTINGISGLGFPFNLTCKLTVDDSGYPAIFEDRIYADFIDTHARGQKQSDIFAPLRIALAEDCKPDEALYINTISAGYNEIFENEDFEDIKAVILNLKQARERELRNKGKLIEPTDKKDIVMEKINNYVGRHIIISNDTKYGTTKRNGILVGCEEYSVDGCPIVEMLDGTKATYCNLGNDASLYTVQNNGKLKIEYSTGKANKLREKIADRIKKCGNSPFGRY